MPLYKSPKSGKLIEVESDFDTSSGVDRARDEAVGKGWQPVHTLVSRSGKTINVDDDGLDEALSKGWQTQGLASAKKSKVEVGAGESLARGVAQGTTFGFADEAQAALRAPFSKRSYGELRDEYRSLDKGAEDQNPVAFYGGSIGAGLVGGSGGAAKGAAALAKQGIAMGAIGGFGGAEGDAKSQALSTAAGGVFGGLIGGVAGKIGNSIEKKSVDALRSGAGRAAYRATGGMKSDINKIYGNTPAQVGQNLLDEGVLPVFAKRAGSGLENRMEGRVSELAAKQGAFMNALDATGDAVPFATIEQKFLSEIQRARGQPGVANKKYADAVQAELDDLRSTLGVGLDQATEVNVTPRARHPQISGAKGAPPAPGEPTLGFQQTLDAKRSYDQAGKFQNRTEAHSVEAARVARKALKDALDESIAASKAGPEAMQAYKSDRNKSKLLLDGLRGLREENNRQTARKQAFGLTDTIAGTGIGTGALAAGVGGLPALAVGAAAVGGKKLVENFGDAFAARTLNSAAKIIERYGFDEGMNRITQAVGKTAATQIGIALGHKEQAP